MTAPAEVEPTVKEISEEEVAKVYFDIIVIICITRILRNLSNLIDLALCINAKMVGNTSTTFFNLPDIS